MLYGPTGCTLPLCPYLQATAEKLPGTTAYVAR